MAGGGQVLPVGLQGPGEVVPQLVPEPLDLPGPLPDQRLVRAGQHLQALRGRAVAGHRPQLMGVGPDHIREHVRVSAVALGPRHRMPRPEPRCLQRVHPEHRVPGRDQRLRPTGRDRSRSRPLPPRHRRPRPGDPRSARAVRPSPRRPRAAGASPAPGPRRPSPRYRDDPQPSHPRQTAASGLRPGYRIPTCSQRENHRGLMNQCSRRQAGTTSQQRSSSPGHRRGHALCIGLQSPVATVLTRRRPPATEPATRRPDNPH